MTRRALILGFILLFAGSVAATQFSTPMARVKDSVDKVITILRIDGLDREERWRQIAAVIDGAFDFRSMSQSVLATHWQRATPAERERFTEFFSQYIEETYRAKIEAYTDEHVDYVREQIEGDRAVVETEIITSSTRIPVNFKLKNNDGEWYAYDVVIEGVSLVSNYRETFSAIAKNEGMDGLMSDIQRRIKRYREEQASETESNSAAPEPGPQ